MGNRKRPAPVKSLKGAQKTFDENLLKSCGVLRQNNGILTKEAYSMRKSYLTKEETGELWR